VQKSTHTVAYKIILDLLIEFRLKAGLTQKQLGDQLPFEQPAISKIERGERRIDLVEMRLICHALGMNLTEFVVELERRLGGETLE
jgi:transcriptional regulator with XRE-family HTH domain